jgi:hypothetical protein
LDCQRIGPCRLRARAGSLLRCKEFGSCQQFTVRSCRRGVQPRDMSLQCTRYSSWVPAMSRSSAIIFTILPPSSLMGVRVKSTTLRESRADEFLIWKRTRRVEVGRHFPDIWTRRDFPVEPRLLIRIMTCIEQSPVGATYAVVHRVGLNVPRDKFPPFLKDRVSVCRVDTSGPFYQTASQVLRVDLYQARERAVPRYRT